jgi:hypothetical protein
MRKLVIILAATLALAGCSTVERDASLGAVAGGAVGALAAGTVGGALAGAAIGAGAAVLIGQATRKGYCVYRDPRTLKTYEAACRAG